MPIPTASTGFRSWKLVLVTSLCLLTACDSQPGNLALGTLERERITLTATAGELILEQPVAEGSVVSKGDLLVQLDQRLQQAQVLKAQADVLQAQANLEKLRNGARAEEVAKATAQVAAARAAEVESAQDLQRLERLAASQLASQAELSGARARYDSLQAQLESTRQQLLELTNGTREEDLRQAEAQLQAAQAILENAQHNLDNLSVLASRDGILDALPWNPGERVYVGAPLAILLADAPPYARVYIPEPVRARVIPNTTLIVHVDGAGSYTGTVRWVANEPAFTPYYSLNSSDRARLVYLAEIQLGEDASGLPSGLPVQVELP
jgi:HlyD family secretion protein